MILSFINWLVCWLLGDAFACFRLFILSAIKEIVKKEKKTKKSLEDTS